MRHCAVHSSSMHEGRGLGRVNLNGGDLWNGNILGVRTWSARGTRAVRVTAPIAGHSTRPSVSGAGNRIASPRSAVARWYNVRASQR